MLSKVLVFMAGVTGVLSQTLQNYAMRFTPPGGCPSGENGVLNIGISIPVPTGASGVQIKQVSFVNYGNALPLPSKFTLSGGGASASLGSTSVIQCCAPTCDLAVYAGSGWYNSPCGKPSGCGKTTQWYTLDFSGTPVGSCSTCGMKGTGSIGLNFDFNGSPFQIGHYGSGTTAYVSYYAIPDTPSPTMTTSTSPIPSSIGIVPSVAPIPVYPSAYPSISSSALPTVCVQMEPSGIVDNDDLNIGTAGWTISNLLNTPVGKLPVSKGWNPSKQSVYHVTLSFKESAPIYSCDWWASTDGSHSPTGMKFYTEKGGTLLYTTPSTTTTLNNVKHSHMFTSNPNVTSIYVEIYKSTTWQIWFYYLSCSTCFAVQPSQPPLPAPSVQSSSIASLSPDSLLTFQPSKTSSSFTTQIESITPYPGPSNTANVTPISAKSFSAHISLSPLVSVTTEVTLYNTLSGSSYISSSGSVSNTYYTNTYIYTPSSMASTSASFSASPSVFPLMGVAMTNATALLLSTINSEQNSQNTILGSTAVGLGGASVIALLLMYLKGNGPSSVAVKEKLKAIFLPILKSPSKLLEVLKNPRALISQLNTVVTTDKPVEESKPSSVKSVEAGIVVPGSKKKVKKIIKKTVPKETVVAVVKPKVVVKKTVVKKAVPQTKKLNSEIYNDITTTIPIKEGDIYVGAVKKTKVSKKQCVEPRVAVNNTVEAKDKEVVEVLEETVEKTIEEETLEEVVEEEEDTLEEVVEEEEETVEETVEEDEVEEEEVEEEEVEETVEEEHVEIEVEEEEEEEIDEELVALPGSTQELVKIEFDKAHLEEITAILNAMKKQYSVLT